MKIGSYLNNRALYNLTPGWLRSLGRQLLPFHSYINEVWAKENEYVNTKFEWGYNFGSEYSLGIFYDLSHYHRFYIKACIEEKITYRVIKLHSDNWIDLINESGCDAFLAYPTVVNTVWKKMFDDRLHFIVNDLHRIVFPDIESLWLYESKSRLRDFCRIQGIKQPKTYIFYDLQEAKIFAHTTSYPVVLKIDQAAASHGVWILRNRSEGIKMLNRIFKKGILVRRGDPRDRHWGKAIFQEYLHEVEEWRIVRVGDTYFSRLKHKIGDFHSGSGKVSWAKPPVELLSYVRNITDQHSFRSVAIDLFFSSGTNEFWVNEVQALFGEIKKTNLQSGGDNMGKFQFIDGSWVFTPGFYYDNACSNLRVRYVLDVLIPGNS